MIVIFTKLSNERAEKRFIKDAMMKRVTGKVTKLPKLAGSTVACL